MAELTPNKVVMKNNEKLTFETKYGEIELKEDNLISFSEGLVGLSNCTVFGLAQYPGIENSPFLILQCVNFRDEENNAPNFTVVDYKAVNLEYSESDYKEAMKAAGANLKDAAILLIVKEIENSDGVKSIVVNAQAPIVLDITNKIAKQVILNNKELSIQHEL